MKRALHLLVLILVLLVYAMAKSTYLIQKINPYWFDIYQYGDLYRFSYLAEYKDTTVPAPVPPASARESNVDLFVLGDSYSGPFKKENFPLARHYSFANWNHVQKSRIRMYLDTQACNVLILQTAEKHILSRFEDGFYKNFLLPVDPVNQDHPESAIQYSPRPKSRLEKLESLIGSPAIMEQNMGILLFSNPVAMKIKELKAEFNRAVFNRIADEVEEYKEKGMLLHTMTTDEIYKYSSSFRRLKEPELEMVRKNLGLLNQYYRKAGFDTVMVAFVPNPVSVINPSYKGKTYNRLIPRLESTLRGLGVVSVFDALSVGKETYFRKGDTHWNPKGAEVWQNTVNQHLLNLLNVKTSPAMDSSAAPLL